MHFSSVQSCSAIDIIQLNQTKAYVLTADGILSEVLTGAQGLTANAIRLWQVLYQKARFDNELAVTITIKELAALLLKSSRSIMRYLKELCSKGFLLIQHNIGEFHNKLANTFFIRLPASIITKLQNKPDRQGKTASPYFNLSLGDKIVMKESDKIVSSNINNANVILNKIPVLAEKEEEAETAITKEALATKIQQDEQAQQNCFEVLATEKDPHQKWVHLQTINTLSATIAANKVALQRWESPKPSFSPDLPPKQVSLLRPPFTALEVTFVREKLQHLGFYGSHAQRLLNEICYAIRFTSLGVNRTTGLPHNNKHALHIAFKLIKQKRWTTPTDLR